MDLPLEVTTSSFEETEELGRSLAALLDPGDVVWLDGDLGAGKTVLVRGCLEACGVEGPITSPTFTIARQYSGKRFPISHLDLYRLSDGLGGEDPGMFDPEFGGERVTLIEWPRRGEGVLPAPTLLVEIEHGGDDSRRVRIQRCP